MAARAISFAPFHLLPQQRLTAATRNAEEPHL
jgi:hypothetical protein